MTTIKSRYIGSLRTEAEHLKSGNRIITDAPVDNNGKGEAFSPTDLVCAALGSCMMTIMGMVAEREGIDLTGTEWEITKTMAASPRRIAQIDVTFIFPKLDITEKQIKILKNAAETCPVAYSLDPAIKQNIVFNF
jgi:putative redox protein